MPKLGRCAATHNGRGAWRPLKFSPLLLVFAFGLRVASVGNTFDRQRSVASLSMPTRKEVLANLLGLSPARVLWGSRAPDLGLSCCSCASKREAWYEMPHSEHGHGGGQSWWTTAFYEIPVVRQTWGEKQGTVHAGGQELFLDLIFVGVAFRVGQVLKSCIYACSDVSSSYGGNSSYSGRVLAAGGGTADPCLSLELAILHSLAPFVCMYTVWDIEKKMRSSYSVNSKVHAALDLANDMLLILTGMNVQAANAYREHREPSLGLARVLIPILGALGVWMLRIAEICFLSSREGARRQSAGELLTCLQLAAIWGAALALSATTFDTPSVNAAASDASAALIWLGNFWWIGKQGVRTLAELHLPGALPLERTTVCPNTGFVLHRNNEFMFLMLGETVLQIVVAISPGKVSEEGEGTAVATAAGGFLLAVCMMVSFRAMVRGQLDNYERTNLGLATQAAEAEGLLGMLALSQAPSTPPRLSAQVTPADSNLFGGGAQNGASSKRAPLGGPPAAPGPRAGRVNRSSLIKKMIDTKALDERFEAKARRILLHMRMYNVLNTYLWEFKALTVMMTGVGVKLAIYKPTASPHEHFALAQRLQLSIAIAGVFFIQLFHTIFVKNRHHYSLRTMGQHPTHVFVVTLRICLICACPAVAIYKLQPYQLILVLAAMSVAQCALLQIQDFKFNIHSTYQHPMREMANALQSMQQRRKRAAEQSQLRRASTEIGRRQQSSPPGQRGGKCGHTSDRSHTKAGDPVRA